MTSSLAESRQLGPGGDATGSAVLFGAPFDPDERTSSVRAKAAWMRADRAPFDLVEAVVRAAEGGLDGATRAGPALPGEWRWLSPTPDAADVDRQTEAEHARFVDEGGCERLAAWAETFVRERVSPHTPVMVGVDHSVSGGVLRALAERHGVADLAVVVLDSHTDAIPTTATAGAVHYDARTNPRSVYDVSAPLVAGRPDSYNASTFLHHLLAQGVIEPRNLYLVGVADMPPSRARKIDDEGMRAYVSAFTDLRAQGVTVLTHEEVAGNPARLGWELARSRATHAYVSIDLDVGADAVTKAVRFRDRRGLSAATIERLVDEIVSWLSGGVRLAGADVMEFDVRAATSRSASAGAGSVPAADPDPDPVFTLAARSLTRLLATLAGHVPTPSEEQR